MAVAGINSATGSEGATNALDVAALDYHPDEVSYFSYAADGGPYTAADTWSDLLTAGRRLGAQLRAIDAAQPGREVDLIAHSQGGVVVDVFLKFVYDAADPRYPPIGTIVTLASPHEGAPLATAAAQLRSTRSGRAVLGVAEGVLPVPPATARSPRQLGERSAFLAALDARPLPDHLDYTTIGVATDVIVPATNVGLDGATEAVVDVGALDAHSAALTDPGVLQAVRAGLEGRPPPCVGVVDALTGAVAPVLIRRAEHIAGDAGALAGRAADTLAP
jgi:triacylglycerol esterase/lipase EstA (alpha/beta hydrolase family)